MTILTNSKTPEITEYFHTSETGDAKITVYRLFPGVEVTYMSVHMADFDFSLTEPTICQDICQTYILIHYCQEGRIEQQIDDESFYLMPGDCSIIIQDRPQKLLQLPLQHYHGIHIKIDLTVSQNPLIDFLKNCGFLPLDVWEMIYQNRTHAVLRSSKPAQRFFEDVYTTDPSRRLDYLRIKLPELFYQLKYDAPEKSCYDRVLIPRAQAKFVKNVSDYITRHLCEKLTLKILTKEFGVSDTYMQNAFRTVYGMPVISFIRAQKMQSAAQILIHTNQTIEEIAEAFGYENESKFSSAFKKIMGDPPGTYRRQHSKVSLPL